MAKDTRSSADRAWALAVALGFLLFAGDARGDDASLPRGIHRALDGRYYQDVTDWRAHRHALARRLLPSYVPTHAPDAPGGVGGGGGASTSFCAAEENSDPLSSPPEGALGPTEVASAYGVPSSATADGQVVALIEMPDSNAASDLAAYRSAYGLAALPACTSLSPLGPKPCFAAVDQSGSQLDPAVTDCAGSDPETGLDTEMVSAACPDCSILVVQMTSADQTEGPSDQNFIDAVATAAKLGAVASSISFGGPESGKDPTGFTTPGHLVVAASGDEGYLLEGDASEDGDLLTPSYPASAPDVLSIGGTDLEEKSSGYTEVVWNERSAATTSGCSLEFAMPAYQAALGASTFGSCVKRASVDLAAVAQYTPANATPTEGGIAEYDSRDQWVQVVGTSAAAPLVAAILVRVGLAVAVSNDFGVLYQHESALNDVTSGTDDGVENRSECTSGDVMCTAGKGWDGPTGLGTPNGPLLVALAAETATTTSTTNTASGSVTGCTTVPGNVPRDAPVILAGFGVLLLCLLRRRR